ncbi:MAG: heme-binding protein [Burkholderiales bacterium]
MSVKTIVGMAIVVSIAVISFGAAAQQGPPPYGMNISVDVAKKAAAGAVAEARKNNWSMAVAVTDTAGTLVYFERMDDTQSGSINIALGKSRSASMFRRPTKVFQDLVAKGSEFTYLLGLEGAVVVQGGIPIVMDGKVVGGLGVSGGTGAQDLQAAEAGIAALK